MQGHLRSPQPAQAVAGPLAACGHRAAFSGGNAPSVRRQPRASRLRPPLVAMRDGLGADFAEAEATYCGEAEDLQQQQQQADGEDEETWELVPMNPVGFTEEQLADICDQPSPDPDTQQTLVKSFVVEGFTQHSDTEAVVRVMPAYAGEGRYFVRVPEGSIPRPPPPAEEAAEQQPELPPDVEIVDEEEAKAPAPEPEQIVPQGAADAFIPATLDHALLQPDCLWPTLLRDSDRVMAADALLAALEACGVDNARIELQGNGELPAYDGSAAGWVQEVKGAGLRPAPRAEGGGPAPTQRLRPPKVVLVREGEAFISLVPAAAPRISCGLDRGAEAPVIGAQWATWAPSDADQLHFRWAVAPARHCFASPQERLDRLAQGYFKSGVAELTAVADGDAWQQPEELRYGWDEPARRRLLELVADLSLLSTGGRGGLPAGHITAWNASRGLQLKFLRALQRVCGEAPEDT